MYNSDIKIDAQEAERLTRQLIQIPSINPPGDVDECASFMTKWLIDNGIPAEVVKVGKVSNVVARIGDERGKKLLWNGHFDVVPPGDNWETDPFAGVVKDGFIYGRGASDMKSGLSAMMLALKELKKVDLNGQIIFMGIGDEETGSENGTRALLSLLGNGYDAAVVSEPTDFCIESAQRGLRWINVKISGKACHAGRPHVGKNAVEYAAKVISAVKKIKFDIKHDLFETGLKEPSLSVTMISGGIQSNIIPESCTFLIDRRMMPGETEKKVVDEIQKAVDQVREEGFSVQLELVNKGWDPFIIDQNEKILECIKASYQAVTKETPKIRGKGGCTDASHIFNAGIPVVILGPGSANESHTANEKVEIGRIVKAAEIYADSAIKYLSE